MRLPPLSLYGWLASALATIAFIGTAWWLVIGRPAQLKSALAQSRAQEVSAGAAAGAAKDALEITVKTTETVRQIDLTTQRSSHEILTAPGATSAIDPELHRRGVVALCLRDGTAGDPVCTAMLHPDGPGLGAEQASTTRGNPGQP